jgi:DNA helicase-2/ATP-dependent DNA helicase PcrA
LVILGHAGSGKTTVALHRLALLNFRNRQRFRQERLCVVVPDKGLVRLSRKLLDGLSLTKISVISSDNFVESRLRRVAKNVPQRVNRDYSWDIAKFKRHEAWLKVLPKFIELQAAEVQRILVSKYHYAESSAELATQLDSDPLLVRLEKAYAAERKLQSSAVHRSHQIDDGYHRVKRRLLNASQDLADLFTNEDILAEVVKASSGELTMEQATICFRRSKLQSDSAPSSHYKDIDEDRLQTVDGGHLTDDATSDDLNNTMDIDDAPLLMLLRRMKRGLRRGQAEGLHLYEHIVVDEAQDLSALELQCIGAALDANGTVTVAGDSVQQINNTSSFSSWQSVARNLDVSAPLVNQLETSYRSPAPIAAFAHAVLGPLAPPKAPRTIRDGMPIHYDHMPNEGHLIIKLIDVLRDLTSKEPNASIAVVCKSPETATRFYKLLVDLPRIRLVFDGEFEFLPGVDVTTVFEIKGLEFDYVIMPDVHAAAYPDTLDARRQLHVAATRAIHQLWIISVGLASPLLAALKTEPI